MSLRKQRITLQGLSNQSEVFKSSTKKLFGNKSDVLETKKMNTKNLDKKTDSKRSNEGKKFGLTLS